MKKKILTTLGVLVAVSAFLVGQPISATSSGPKCVTCQPDGCYDNYIGVLDCEDPACGNIWPCQRQW